MSGSLGAHDGDDARATRAPAFNDEALTAQEWRNAFEPVAQR